MKKTSNAQRPTSNVEDEQIVRRGLRRHARKIAKSLFTFGDGTRAKRLVFEFPNQNFLSGGWSEKAIADTIERALLKAGGLK